MLQGVDLPHEINFCLPVASKFIFGDVEKGVLQGLNWDLYIVFSPGPGKSRLGGNRKNDVSIGRPTLETHFLTSSGTKIQKGRGRQSEVSTGLANAFSAVSPDLNATWAKSIRRCFKVSTDPAHQLCAFYWAQISTLAASRKR